MFSTASLLVASLLLCASVGHGTLTDLADRSLLSSSQCCEAISLLLPGKVSNPASATYLGEQNGTGAYWSLQEASLSPTCRVTPSSTLDVSVAVGVLSVGRCQFAVRSGGHMSFAGAANIQGGITIDLSALDSVTPNAAGTQIAIGPGARWGNVYDQITPQSLMVVGGRVTSVGVGGLITGGGISFWSPKRGFACDNVAEYEVVLGNGAITTASATQNQDLWVALRGASGNLGIVTKFTLESFKAGDLWGGSIYHLATNDTLQACFNALYWYGVNQANGMDNGSVVINSYGYVADEGGFLIANIIDNTDNVAYPPLLSNFSSITPQLENTLRSTNMSSLAAELDAGTPYGKRSLFGTATVGNSAALFAAIYAQHKETFADVFAISSAKFSMTFQPFSKAMLAASAAAGGNVLGLSPSQGNLVAVGFTIQWDDIADDAVITAASEAFPKQVQALAATYGLQNDYLYLNYAVEGSDPITAYGASNVAKLQAASKKYDPSQIFQKLVPGGFKLPK
ncbi:hypothetical protein B7494_g7474 [Chlorociboria aeruginascens]|nr:hypothetical protein B7494_g7474 [Chlorociboria aeruginascens]